MSKPSLATSSIAELSAALRDGRTTAMALAEEAIAAQTRHEGTLNAYRTWSPELTRRQATAADAALAAGYEPGPLAGIPVSVKDLYGVAGYDSYAGSPKRLPQSWEAEGPVVAAARRSLAVVTGKTHTVEFAFGGVGTNPHWPVPRNPWDAAEARAPGGSSSGAGVSLWEGSCRLAFGSDTAGSVRVPASVTGTFGLKTSFGRWSVEGICPLSTTLDTAGILTLSAEDAAAAFSVIDPVASRDASAFLAGAHRSDGRVRLGVCAWFFEGAEPGIAEAVRTALAELERAGAKLVDVSLPILGESDELFRAGGVTGIEFAEFINGPMRDWRASLDPNVQQRFSKLEQVPAVEYLARRRAITDLTRRARAAFDGIDFLVGPTVPITPPTLTRVADFGAYVERNLLMLRNTAPGNMLTMCGASIPVGKDAADMPVGLQILAPSGEDEAVLAAAVAFERTLGTPAARLGTPPCVA